MTDKYSAGTVTPVVLSLDEAVARILERRRLPVETVLVDGPSGAGKSTLADALVAAWPGPVSLVRMDDIYPGWGGLAAGSRTVHDGLLLPRRLGDPAHWQRYDWQTTSPAELHAVPGDRTLLLEGCGALSRRNAPLATLRLWLDADDDVRKRRALARDDGGFDAHWDDWQRQFVQFLDEEEPRDLADLHIRLP